MFSFIPSKKRFMIAVLILPFFSFFYSMFSNVALPWHQMESRMLENGGMLTTAAVKIEALTAGVYMLPTFDFYGDYTNDEIASMQESMRTGPYAYMIIHPNGIGYDSYMTFNLIMQFITLLVVVKFLAFIFLMVRDSAALQSHFRRAIFGASIVSIGTFLMAAQYANWYAFPVMTTLVVNVADTFIGWFLTSYLLSRFLIKKVK